MTPQKYKKNSTMFITKVITNSFWETQHERSMCSYVHLNVCHLIGINVRFNQITYDVNEDEGPARPTLVLSNPSSTDLTVQVRDFQGTAES